MPNNPEMKNKAEQANLFIHTSSMWAFILIIEAFSLFVTLDLSSTVKDSLCFIRARATLELLHFQVENDIVPHGPDQGLHHSAFVHTPADMLDETSELLAEKLHNIKCIA
ncbi:hypothetical protein Ancab_006075 [Ancistrocladus abbreviatus]